MCSILIKPGISIYSVLHKYQTAPQTEESKHPEHANHKVEHDLMKLIYHKPQAHIYIQHSRVARSPIASRISSCWWLTRPPNIQSKAWLKLSSAPQPSQNLGIWNSDFLYQSARVSLNSCHDQPNHYRRQSRQPSRNILILSMKNGHGQKGLIIHKITCHKDISR